MVSLDLHYELLSFYDENYINKRDWRNVKNVNNINKLVKVDYTEISQ